MSIEAVIKNAIADANDIPDQEVETTELETSTESSEAPVSEPTEEAVSESEESTSSPLDAVSTTKEKPAPAAEDDFAKKHGIAEKGQFGKENRIPYSRVKKIVANAEKALQEAFAKEREQFKDFDTIKAEHSDYRQRLEQVAEFERVMTTDHTRFLNMLITIPGYKEIFDQLLGSLGASTAPATTDPLAGMPEPSEVLPDGSKAYSKADVAALLDWKAKQIEKAIDQKYSSHFGEIQKIREKEEAQRRVEALIPKVQAQIDAARQWPLFTDNEPEIVKVLQSDPNISLEGAYQRVVLPKLQTDTATLKDRMRAELLAELKAAPASTSAPSSRSKPGAPRPTGPRDIKDVIEESIQHLRR